MRHCPQSPAGIIHKCDCPAGTCAKSALLCEGLTPRDAPAMIGASGLLGREVTTTTWANTAPAPQVDRLAALMGCEWVTPAEPTGTAQEAPGDTTNPKDALGALKAPTLSVVPSSALLALGGVMRLGASKYGRFNWRHKAVRASVYTDAALRHLMSWSDGEDRDPESGELHLAHVAACMSILIDADARGRLVDDRDCHEELKGSAAHIIRETTRKAA